MIRSAIALLFLFLSVGCATGAAPPREQIDQMLDAWHEAAAHADEEGYFGSLASDAVFLGTDATERWRRDEFERLMMPYFQRETAWTYVPIERHVSVSPGGELGWFDERLHNEKYGECRGTGVVRLERRRWKIVQYNLTFPIPNDLAQQVVGLIREHQQK